MRNRYILFSDLPLIAIAAYGAFALRFDWLFPKSHPEFAPFLVAALLLKPTVFYAFGMYGRYWRYASAQDLLAVALAVLGAATTMAVFVGVGAPLGLTPFFSRQVLLIDCLLTLTLVGGLRMSVRVVGDARQRAQKGNARSAKKRVLIAGAGEAGTLVAREMLKNPQLGLQPVGFVDDAPEKQGKSINGIRVLAPLAAVHGTVKTWDIDEVVIALPSAGGRPVRAVVEQCRLAGVVSRVVPGVFELLDGHASVSRLRQVDIVDLLGRNQVVGSPEAASYVKGRTVLVTGAGGSIGSELCRQVAFANPASLVLVGHGENSIYQVQNHLAEQYPGLNLRAVIADIRDRARMESVFMQFSPHIVFHAAAHKHVPLMEENPEEAISNNVLGTSSVVAAAEKCGTLRLVLISTDKAVSPSSVMGASKRLAERLVRDAGERSGRAYVVVRFGNVLGSRGSVVPFFKRQIERGGPITITHPDMKRFFMTIPEAVHLVLQAGGMGAGGELFVLNMGEPVRICDLAKDLVRLSGLDPDEIPIVFTGLRPGEKLEEALWEPGAVVKATTNPDVLRVSEPEGLPELDSHLASVVTSHEAADLLVAQLRLAGCLPNASPSTRPPVKFVPHARG